MSTTSPARVSRPWILRVCGYCLLVLALLVVTSGEGRAQPTPAEGALSAADAQTAMEEYFAGEKQSGLVLGGMGLAGLVVGGLLLRDTSPIARGASYPLLGIGLLHLAAGGFVYLASDKRIDAFGDAIASDSSDFVTGELGRMKGVRQQFTALKIVEIALMAGGGAAAVIGAQSDRKRLLGAGFALSLEAALTLGFDVIAAQRANRYIERLEGPSLEFRAQLDGGPSRLLIVYGVSW